MWGGKGCGGLWGGGGCGGLWRVVLEVRVVFEMRVVEESVGGERCGELCWR